METCDMVCWHCFYGFQDVNEPLKEMLKEEELEDHPHHQIICNYLPEPKMIATYASSPDRPDILADPHFHTCGCGRWYDEVEKVWLRLHEAEDWRGSYTENHSISFLEGTKEKPCDEQ